MKEKRWFQKQLRILQTVLREPDVVNYNAEEVVRYMEEIDANCLVINAGGIVDFFRHPLSTANPNPFMDKEDILKDITQKCHEKGITVIARVDFRGVNPRLHALHPDWFALDEHGEPVLIGGLQPLYAPCYLSYYRNEHAYQFANVLFELYDIDGIWENSPFQYGVCYCPKCSAGYIREIGKELPRGGNYYSEQYDEYRVWKQKNLLEHMNKFQLVVKRHGADKIYCGEIFGLFYERYKSTGSDLYNVKDYMDFMVTPLFTAPYLPLHAPSTLIKFLGSLGANKTPVMLFGHLGMDNQLRYVSAPPEETRIWMWQAVSAGGSLWNTVFNGQHPAKTHDRRNAYLVKEVYSYMKKYEDLLHHQRPVASTAIYYSRSSNLKCNQSIFPASDVYSNLEKDHYIVNLIGMEQVLLDRHIQYDIITDLDFSIDKLKKIKLLIVPNGAVLSGAEVEVIRQFVENGGHLLATYQTSLYDETGKQRENFALSDVFGCTYTGINKDTARCGYQYVKENHPITKGLEQTELIANWGENLLVLPNESAKTEVPLTFVPPIYPQHPESSWLPSLQSKFPTAIVNTFGKGKAVYFPYEIDRHVWMQGHHDFSMVLGNAAEYLLEGHQLIQTNAPASVQLALTQVTGRSGCYLLHGMNLTSYPRRPVESFIPVHNITVELTLSAKELRNVDVLKGDAEVEYSCRLLGDEQLVIKIDIPIIKDYIGLLIAAD